MIKTYKVMLIPNNKQKTRMLEFSDASRFVYNKTIELQQNNYKNGGKFISEYNIMKEFTLLKKTNEYLWLNKISNKVLNQAVIDACNAYKNFFNGYTKFPKFKSKKKSKPSFYQAVDKIKFTNTHVKLEKISLSKRPNKKKLNWIRLAEHNRIPINCKYYNPRVTFDGLNWWISVGVEVEDSINTPLNNGIGIDLGIKDLAVCSDGNVYKNINKSQTVKKLEKKKRRLQRSISRKYESNKKGESYCKTSNIIKSEKKLLKLNHRLINIRHNYLHQITSEIVRREPSFICIEDLNVSGMMKNKHLSKAIQEQCFYEFRIQLEYKCRWNNIQLIIADRYFPSSKLCSECGSIKKDLKLSDRIYICPECGNIINRDYQASLNLKRYGENVLDIKSVAQHYKS